MFENLQDDTTNVDDVLQELRTRLKSWTKFDDIYISYMNMHRNDSAYKKLTNIVNNRINNKGYNTDFFIIVGIIFNSEIMHTMINLKLNNPHFTIYMGGTEMFYIRNNRNGEVIPMQKYIKNYSDKLNIAERNFKKLKNM